MPNRDELNIDLSQVRASRVVDDAHVSGGPDFAAIFQEQKQISKAKDLTLSQKGILNKKIEQIFTREMFTEAVSRVKTNLHPKHLLPEETSSGLNSDDLMRDLFKLNKAVALGDLHPSKELHEFVIEKLPKWKEFGLAAFGVEVTQTAQPTFDRFHSIEKETERLNAYDTYLEKGKAFVKNNPDNPFVELTKNYNQQAASIQDVDGLHAIRREAIAENLLLCGMDSPIARHAEQFSQAGEHDPNALAARIAATNFDWSNAISNVEKSISGNLIEFGGKMHFDNYNSGYVDELTGAPSIRFVSANKDHPANSYAKSDNPDFDYMIYIDDPSGTLKFWNDRDTLKKAFFPAKPFELPAKPIEGKLEK